MAKAGSAGERRRGARCGWREGSLGQGKPHHHQVGGGTVTRPDPGACIRGSARPASFPRPQSPRGTPHPACPAALGQVCGSSVQLGAVAALRETRGVDPGTGTQRGCPTAADPSHAQQTRTRPLVLSLCILDATVPHPCHQLGQETQIAGPTAGGVLYGWGAAPPPTQPRGRASGAGLGRRGLYWGPMGSVLL